MFSLRGSRARAAYGSTATGHCSLSSRTLGTNPPPGVVPFDQASRHQPPFTDRALYDSPALAPSYTKPARTSCLLLAKYQYSSRQKAGAKRFFPLDACGDIIATVKRRMAEIYKTLPGPPYCKRPGLVTSPSFEAPCRTRAPLFCLGCFIKY